MNYLALIFSIFFIVFIIFSLWEVYINDKKNQLIVLSKRPENIPIELRAYKDTFGITDKEFISTLPYCLEYKSKDDNWWKPIYMFQEINVLNPNDKNILSRIAVKDKEDLEKWKLKFKTLKDIQDFRNKQEVVKKLWDEKEINKNCIY